MLVILCLVFEAGTCYVARLRLMVLSWLRVLQCIYTVGSFVQITICAKIFPVFSCNSQPGNDTLSVWLLCLNKNLTSQFSLQRQS